MKNEQESIWLLNLYIAISWRHSTYWNHCYYCSDCHHCRSHWEEKNLISEWWWVVVVWATGYINIQLFVWMHTSHDCKVTTFLQSTKGIIDMCHNILMMTMIFRDICHIVNILLRCWLHFNHRITLLYGEKPGWYK